MIKNLFLFLALFFSPMLAFAHEAAVEEIINKGFEEGLKHPVLGLDHLLAMVGVGIVSAQMGGRAVWAVPAMFVTSMMIGGILGMIEYDVGAIEVGIAMSVVLLGLVIAANAKIMASIIYGFVALFGIFHGYAHGVEMPTLAVSWIYILGFMIGTSSLHIVGVFIGLVSNKINHGSLILRYSGAFMAGMGFHILLGIIIS